MSKKVTKKSPASSRATNGPALEFRNVDFAYGTSRRGGDKSQEKILDGLSFAVPARGLMSLLGPSGAGKTTILRLALGLEKPDSGEIFINRQLVSNNQFVLPPEKRGVGLLFQDIALFPHLTVFDNIAFGLNNIGLNNIGLNNRNGTATNKKLSLLDKKNIVTRWLEQIGLPGFGNRYPHQLSGGEQQRVALARALAPGSRLILMDEPFSSLNERTRDDMRNWVLNFLAARGIAALMVTHSVEEAMLMSDSIAVLDDKKLQQHGTPADIYYHPNNKFVATMFGAVNQFYAEVQQGRVTTPLGHFTANHHGEKFHDGQMVAVIIRADAVHLQPGNKKIETTNEKITGTITDVRFLGQHSFVTWRTDNGKDASPAMATIDSPLPNPMPNVIHSRIATNHAATRLATGDRVRATIDKNGVFVFADK